MWQLQRSILIVHFPLSAQATGDLRLAGGLSNAGRLEIYVREEWGTVCSDDFDLTDAMVACRQLGFSAATRHGTVSELR